MNEKTILEKRTVVNGQTDNKKEGKSWKQVILGGAPGILMGAGLQYAGEIFAARKADVSKETAETETAETVTNENETAEIAATEAQQSENVAETALPIAQTHNDLSFGQAFAAARAEVGPGGVFVWHGGIYNTYTAEEWSAMTVEEKSDFAHRVNPKVVAQDVATPTDAHPDVVAQSASETDVHTVSDTSDVEVVEQQIAQNFDVGEDVHIVGYANADGHLVVGYDSTGDGQADVAIIDVDGDLHISDADVIMDREGNMARLGDLQNEQTNQRTAMENPDVAPDMPDYMNDANTDDMNAFA